MVREHLPPETEAEVEELSRDDVDDNRDISVMLKTLAGLFVM
jgi:hypothetical protein